MTGYTSSYVNTLPIVDNLKTKHTQECIFAAACNFILVIIIRLLWVYCIIVFGVITCTVLPIMSNTNQLTNTFFRQKQNKQKQQKRENNYGQHLHVASHSKNRTVVHNRFQTHLNITLPRVYLTRPPSHRQ